jgi:hypothetical protein
MQSQFGEKWTSNPSTWNLLVIVFWWKHLKKNCILFKKSQHLWCIFACCHISSISINIVKNWQLYNLTINRIWQNAYDIGMDDISRFLIESRYRTSLIILDNLLVVMSLVIAWKPYCFGDKCHIGRSPTIY